MAATKDLRPTSSEPIWQNVGKSYMLKQTVDFSETANQLAQNETLALFDVPADCRVAGYYKVNTVDSDVTDTNFGLSTDGSTANDLLDAGTLAATGYVQNGTTIFAFTTAASQVVFTNIDADTLNEADVTFIVIVTPLTDGND